MIKTRPLGVVVPIYKDSFSNYEELSFYHNIEILSKRDIYLLGPKRLERFLNTLSKNTNKCKVHIVKDEFFDGTLKGNSRLMRSEGFYDFYKYYEYILICHFDAFVFKDQLDFWMSTQLDYIGAPVFENESSSFKGLKSSLNGGLCLRRVESFRKILSGSRSYRERISIIWNHEKNFLSRVKKVLGDGFTYNYKFPYLRALPNEDTFWSVTVPQFYPWFRKADFNTARFFSFEINTRFLYNYNDKILPFGIHAWWKYDKKFCIKLIQQTFPDISIPETNDKAIIIDNDKLLKYKLFKK